MSDLLLMMSRPELIRLGWALVHFLWQGLVIAALLEIALGFIEKKKAAARYVLCGWALAMMPICLVGTYAVLGEKEVAPAVPVASFTAPAGVFVETTTAPTTLPPVPVGEAIPEFVSREVPSFDLDRCMPVVVAIWLLGVMVLAGRKAGGFYVLWVLRRRGISTPSDVIAELFQDACGKLGIDPRRVILKISSLVQVPMTMGWVSPIVLFPAALLTGLSTGEIELLLAHELAHIRRRDYLVNLLQTVVETIFFYHPVTWWISRRMRQERENACDDLVTAESADVLEYAQILLRLAAIRTEGTWLVSAANGGSLLQRVQRLAGETNPGPAMGLPVTLIALALLAIATAVPHLKAQSNPSPVDHAPLTYTDPMSPEEAKQKGIAVLVNHRPIYWADIEYNDLNPEPFLRSQHYSGKELEQKLAEHRLGMVENAINRELEMQDAERMGLQVPQSDLDARVDYGVKGFGGSKDAFVKNLEANGSSLEKFNEANRESLLAGQLFNLKVDAPASNYAKSKIANQKTTEPEVKGTEQALFQAESAELENEWLSELKSKAVIQRFDDPKGVLRAGLMDVVSEPMSEKEADAKGIAAIVNGYAIMTSEIDAQDVETVKVLKQNLSGDDLKQHIESARYNVLTALVDRSLIIQDFRAQGRFIPASYTDERVNDIVHDEYGDDWNAFVHTLDERKVSLEKYHAEIEANAIVGSERNNHVAEKITDYYQNHLDLFPQDEQVSVTEVQVREFASSDKNSPEDPGSQILQAMKAGADVSALAKKYGVNPEMDGKPLWYTKDGPPSWPSYEAVSWDNIEKMKPGEATEGVVDGVYDDGMGKSQPCKIRFLVRVNDRHAATIPSTPETTNEKKTLIWAESERLRKAWIDGLRAKAKLQIFLAAGDPNDNQGQAPALQTVADQPTVAPVTQVATPTQPTAPTQPPIAQPVPATPEAVFAQAITMKEIKTSGPGVTRLFYQGGNIILQQELNVSPGSVGQIVFYKGKELLADSVGIDKDGERRSYRSITPRASDIQIDSIAADSISPAKLRILNSSHQIISEFFIDKDGVMRPITKAEHDADIARRVEKFTSSPDKEKISNDDFITRTDDDSGRAAMKKLKSIIIDKVDFEQGDVAAVLQFLSQKSKGLDPEKTGFEFSLDDNFSPQNHVYRQVTIKLDNVPLDEVLGYVVQQTNLKCSIAGNTIYFKPPAQAAPASGTDNQSPQDFHVRYVQWIKEQLQLTQQQEVALSTAMEGKSNYEIGVAINLTLKQILTPQQKVAWENLMEEHIKELTARAAALHEMDWVGQNIYLFDDQKGKVYDALYAYNFDAIRTSTSMFVRDAPFAEEKVLSGVLTKVQLNLLEKAARSELLAPLPVAEITVERSGGLQIPP